MSNLYNTGGKAVAAGCAAAIGMIVLYLGLLAGVVWLIATIIYGVFF